MSQSTYKLADNVLFQKVADETVILEPETGQYYTLNTVGTFIVENIQLGKTIEAVRTSVLEKYQVNEEEVIQDINELVTQMQVQGLLVEVTSNVS